MDLVDLQQSSKRIRNPFGFDFVGQYNKKPIVLKGDGKWKEVVGPLRDHLARHLYMKIYYQYHDEQVRKFKMLGQKDEARKFRVSTEVENKIWMMITGEPLHKDTGVEVPQDAADLTELQSEISKMETVAKNSNEVVNISKVLEQANVEALQKANGMSEGESTRVKNTAKLKEEPVKTEEVSPAKSEEPAFTELENA